MENSGKKNDQVSFALAPDANISFWNDSILSVESLNTTTESDIVKVWGPEYHRQVRIAVLSVMIVTSLLGNIVMCLHIRGQRQKRSRVQLLFVNLAVADLLVTCFTMTSQLVWESMGREWVGGNIFCPIFKVLQTFTMVSSNYLIVAVALDRHIAIVYPFARKSRTRSLLLAAWLMSLFPSLPSSYIFHEYTTSSGKIFCVAKFYTQSLSLLDRQLYMGFIFLSVFILPMFIIFGLYAKILYVVWTRSRAFRSKSEKESDHSTDSHNYVGCSSSTAHIPRAKVKTLRMTLAVVVTFLACCLPYLIQEMIIAFGDPSILNENVAAMTGIISASNSTLNPYIYLLFNSKSTWAKKIADGICPCPVMVTSKPCSNSHAKSSL